MIEIPIVLKELFDLFIGLHMFIFFKINSS